MDDLLARVWDQQALVVACLLAVLPDLAIRGPLNRLIRRMRHA